MMRPDGAQIPLGTTTIRITGSGQVLIAIALGEDV